MALAATTVWEIDNSAVGSTAASDNGGGFNASRAGAGTDYSLKANSPDGKGAPILSSNVGAMTAGGTTFTTAAGTDHFSAAMVGNLLCVHAGTNVIATPFWAEITAYTDEHTVTIDRDITSGGNASDVHFKVGGCIDTLADRLCEAAVGGNTIYIASASYSCGAISISSVSATAVEPIKVIGYKTTRTAACDGADRPVLDFAANAAFGAGADYWHFSNIIFGTTATAGITLGDADYARNCKSNNTSGSTTRPAFTVRSLSIMLDCEALSTKGPGISMAGNGVIVLNSYIHDCFDGTNGLGVVGYAYGTIINSIVDSCDVGMVCAAHYDLEVVNCTFYGCTTGITGTTAYSNIFLNNILCGEHFTDLVIGSAGNEAKCTSAARPFTATDVGKTLTITGGTGWTLQTVTISGVAAAVATCSAALGTADSTGGVADMGIGASWTTQTEGNMWDWNNFYNLGADRTKVTAGPNDYDTNPNFTDALNGDFSRTGNPADSFAIRLGVG